MQPAVEQIETAAEKLESKDLRELVIRLAQAYNRRAETEPTRSTNPAHSFDKPAPRRHSVEKLRDSASGHIDARQVADYLGIPLEMLAKAIETRHAVVEKTPTDEALQPQLQPIHRSLEILEDVFGDRASVLAWWSSSHPDLGGRSPMGVMMEGYSQAIADMLEAALMGTPS